MKISIRARLWLLAAGTVSAIVLLATLATWGALVAEEGLARVSQGTVLVAASSAADMAHDAIHNDVLKARLAAVDGDKPGVDEADKALRENSQTLLKELQHLDSGEVRESTRAEVHKALPLAREYTSLAEQAIAALRSEARPKAVIERVEAKFSELEPVLEHVTQGVAADVEQQEAAVRQTQASVRMATLALAVGVGMAIMVVAMLLVRSVMSPINRLIVATRSLNSGDSDLSRRLPAADAELGVLSAEFNTFIGSLAGLVGSIQRVSADIRADSAQIASGNVDLQQRTEQSACSLQETAASAEEINATIRQTAESARQAALLVQQSNDAAERGGQAVGRVTATMDEIAQASNRIADIVGVIEGIAFQTNILALNAAVEAARAGNHGKGFAVVATEVRTLAMRCSDAAREIGSLIQDSVDKVHTGAERVADARKSMDAIVQSIGRVAQMMGEISAASNEQSVGMQQVSTAVAELDQVTQQNAALVEQSTAAAMSLKDRADHLAAAVSNYKLSGA